MANTHSSISDAGPSSAFPSAHSRNETGSIVIATVGVDGAQSAPVPPELYGNPYAVLYRGEEEDE